MELFPIVILAGGMATRLHPLTEKIPKALVKIAGEPFIAHQLRMLKKKGFSKIVMCVWYRVEMIQEFVGDGSSFGLTIAYSIDGEHPLGTAGAIRKAFPLLPDTFFVLYGDSYLLIDYENIQNKFIESNKPGLMTILRNNGLWDKSNVEYKNGSIVCYDKKNTNENMKYIDYGLGVFKKSVFSQLEVNKNYDLADIYQMLIRNNELTSTIMSKRFYEVGSFQGIKELDQLLRVEKEKNGTNIH
ncbi:MAG: sugar phosphate nucleotidyltransferase [Anaerolineaceae bacterium]|nr:sugar phosphate nucleotidyltransferase [Anaerolineaceae bacterium]